jgi:hypothetical protein
MKRIISVDVGSYTFDKTAKTVTFSGLGTIAQSQIFLIMHVPTTQVIYNFADPTKGGTFVPATGVLTLEFDTSSFSNSDELQILVDTDADGYDFTLDAKKTIEQSPTWSRYTNSEAIISSAQTLTTSFADLGPEIDVQGYSICILWIKITIQQSQGVQIQGLLKHTYAGSEEYNFVIKQQGSPSSINADLIELPNSNGLYGIPFECRGMTYLQFQVKMSVDGGTDGTIDTAYVTKQY